RCDPAAGPGALERLRERAQSALEKGRRTDDGTPAAAGRRPEGPLPMTARAGFVSLVGAGPGDPALLTRAALARLRRADLVLFDALVTPEIVALARRARRFSVGK